MYKNKKILAVVMARGGSKGIKYKNLRKINGNSLISISAKLLKKIKIIDKSIISSDNESIIKESTKFGLKKLFKRPDFLSGDIVSDYDVMKHALISAERIDKTKYHLVLMIQPTSPLRQAKHITDCIKLFFKKKDTTSVWSVSKVDTKFHPMKILEKKDSFLKYYHSKGPKIIARQQLDEKYFRNGICYVVSRNTILKEKNLMVKKSVPYIMNDKVLNIDTIEDLELAAYYIKNFSQVKK
jgi:CMP-N-acetylneuraminic acid synthetase